MTTHLPRPIPVHAVGDELPRRATPLARLHAVLRTLGVLLAVAVVVLLLTVDALPLAVLTTAGAIAAPVLITLIRNTEWM